jgi:hypothetical protein
MKVKAKNPPEVHDLGGLVDKDEAERDQAVDAAERNATHQLLNEVQHLPNPPWMPGNSSTASAASGLSDFPDGSAERLHIVLTSFSPKA